MATEDVELVISEDAVAAVADIAYELNQTTENIGARRLTTVMGRLLEDISFEADQMRGQTVLIDKDYVDDHLQDIVEDPDLSRYIL
ncbi:HslU--HslV peptidase ATPase subunit, partial [Candidatus Bipolaricaulota bacterium]|nr:HslU--HslV peptidase ATPase subunit [Candidatus Bipolaricaulota bacterium]